MRRAAQAAVGALGAAAAVVALIGVWPAPRGMLPTPDELAAAAGTVVGPAALLGAVAGAVLGRPRPALQITGGGTGVGLRAAVLLGPCALLAFAALPRSGRMLVQADGTGRLALGAVLLLALAALARGHHRAVAWGATTGALGLGLWLWPAVPRLASVPQDGHPDVVLITLDTLRADALPGWVAGRSPLPALPTPALDGLAARGRVFAAAHSPATLTGPAHTSLLSGLDPAAHGVVRNGQAVPATIPWLPAALARAGYHTTAWTAAAVLGPGLGFGRGIHDLDHQLWRIPAQHRLLGGLAHRPRGARFWRSAATLVDRALAAGLPDLSRPGPEGRPRFVWIHLFDAHWPYAPSAAAREAAGLAPGAAPALTTPVFVEGAQPLDAAGAAALRAAYRAQVIDLDRAIGRLLARVGEDDIVAVVGDHGERMGEGGRRFTHGRGADAPESWVPLVIRAPGLAPGVETAAVATEDLAPTLLALAGVPRPPGMPDHSLVDGAPGDRIQRTAARDGAWALRQGDASLVGTAGSPPTLHDRAADPLEQRPRSGPVPAALAAAWAALPADPPAPAAPAPVDAETAAALRALGYQE